MQVTDIYINEANQLKKLASGRYVFSQITDLKIISIKGNFSVTAARMSSKFRGIDAKSNELSHYGR